MTKCPQDTNLTFLSEALGKRISYSDDRFFLTLWVVVATMAARAVECCVLVKRLTIAHGKVPEHPPCVGMGPCI